MWMSSQIMAFDCMTEVQVTAQVFASEGTGEPSTLVLQSTTQITGEGVTDAREWLRDALIGLLESL